MADALLGPVVDATVAKVIAVASEQFNLAWGWKDDLREFCRMMKMLRDVLQDADEKNLMSTNPPLKSWLRELRDIADEADDVMELVAYENLRRRVANPKPKWKKVSSLFIPSKFHPLVFRFRMANRVKGLNGDLARLTDGANRLGLQSKLATTAVEPMADPQQTNSFLSSPVIGREEDESKIESLLIGSSGGQDLPVIAIVGMPGLGKTTLAKAVSKMPKICEKFGGFVLWVCVSKNFEPEWILKGMLESISPGGDGVNVSSEEGLMRKIQQALGGKDYLLILDDVWSEDRRKWEGLRNCLLGISGNQGNRVLVTTRSDIVASIMVDTDAHKHRLEGLTSDDCWAIIKQRAFGTAEPEELTTLKEVGDKISEKCKGVPLVASLIGATLQNSRGIHEWQSILDDQVWHSLARENGILGIIKLSYDRLPELALKQCFAFCSIFPEDFVMEREMLIQLWMALGFLQPPEESPITITMEEIGDKYFRYLLSYSLFQEEYTDELGRVTHCKMHDSIHEFAVSISNSEESRYIRDLNLIQKGGVLPANLGSASSNLRTLLSWKQDVAANGGVQSDLRRLRVLSVCKDALDAKQLSKCFGNSKSLRYLDIFWCEEMKEFPKFIEKLYNLETFRFACCKFQMPPEGLVNLINLRHIYFRDEERMPSNLGRLTNLQTLPYFFVGAEKGRKIEELGSLGGLKGSLHIRKLELVKDRSEAESAKLHEKVLDELALEWSMDEDRNDEDVLEGLQPHSKLQILKIESFGGRSLPSWMLKNGCGFRPNNLVVLNINECPSLQSIPLMGGFSSLRRLIVWGCKELTEAEFAFPSLKELLVGGCPNLKEFSNSRLPSLQILNIQQCGVESVNLSISKCLREVELSDCHMLRNFPDLSGFSFLRKLCIWSNNNLVHLPSGLSSCTALEVLIIKDCPNLVSIPEELKGLPSLVTLEICKCPLLSGFPKEMLGSFSGLKTLSIGGFSNDLRDFPNFESINNMSTCLQDLSLYGWEKLTQLPHQIRALISLKSLRISNFGGMHVLPEWLAASCTGLESLCISSCHNLVSVPGELKELRSLIQLEISDCRKLRSFPEEILSGLTRLKTLRIGGFSEELEEFIGMSSTHHSLPASLEELTLYGWEKLTLLPHQIQHLPALRDLMIWYFEGVEALPDWVGNLPSLQYLYIYHCTNMKILPSAEVIRRLSKVDGFSTNWTELREKIKQEKRSSSQNQ